MEVSSHEWDLPHDNARGMVCYTMLQERATWLTYKKLQAHLQGDDPALDRILHYISIDECAHYDFFRKLVEYYLAEDRAGTLEQVRLVVNTFAMPALHMFADSGRREQQIKDLRLFDYDIFYYEVFAPILTDLGLTQKDLARSARASATSWPSATRQVEATMPSTARRAVVTGCGVVAPPGNTLSAFAAALQRQQSGVRPIQAYDTRGLPVRFGGEVRDFDIHQYIDKKERKRLAIMPRPLQLGVAAAHLAVQDAALDRAQRDPARFGVIFGGGTIPGCQADLGPAAQRSAGRRGEIDLRRWATEGMPTVPPMWMLNYVPNMLACHVSILHDARGPVNTVTQTEAGGLLALGEAWRMIRRDRADMVLVGGGDSRINPISGIRQCLFSSLSKRNDAPQEACRPFDRNRDGTVLGEGGGAVMLEELEHAQRRGGRILAEVVGFGAALDTDHSGEGLARTIRLALAGAGSQRVPTRPRQRPRPQYLRRRRLGSSRFTARPG